MTYVVSVLMWATLACIMATFKIIKNLLEISYYYHMLFAVVFIILFGVM